MPPYKYQHNTWQRRSVPHALNAAPLKNLAKELVVVAVVRGSETAEVLATQNLITLGTRAFRRAKYDRSSKLLPTQKN